MQNDMKFICICYNRCKVDITNSSLYSIMRIVADYYLFISVMFMNMQSNYSQIAYNKIIGVGKDALFNNITQYSHWLSREFSNQ